MVLTGTGNWVLRKDLFIDRLCGGADGVNIITGLLNMSPLSTQRLRQSELLLSPLIMGKEPRQLSQGLTTSGGSEPSRGALSSPMQNSAMPHWIQKLPGTRWQGT